MAYPSPRRRQEVLRSYGVLTFTLAWLTHLVCIQGTVGLTQMQSARRALPAGISMVAENASDTTGPTPGIVISRARQTPERTEAFVKRLPYGNSIIGALSKWV
jgi:hypothetical protein